MLAIRSKRCEPFFLNALRTSIAIESAESISILFSRDLLTVFVALFLRLTCSFEMRGFLYFPELDQFDITIHLHFAQISKSSSLNSEVDV